MANQPSKYSKFLVGAASAALVAAAVAPAVSAADFSDVKGNTHEEAINALSAAGVISGYPDGSFQPNKTLTRSDVVKLLGKWLVSEGFEIPADAVSNPRFTDLKSTSNKELLEYAAVVKDNGVFNGSNGRLLAGDNITRENMAVVLVRAFDSVKGIDLVTYVNGQDFKKDVKDLNAAKAEAQGAINVLDFFDITNPEVANFNPKGNTTRGHFATFLYKSTNTDFSAVTGVSSSAVESIKAVNSTTVEVTFKEAVSGVKASDFKIEGLTVSNAVAKQENAKVVVLTTSAQEGGKKYEVTYGAKAIGSFVAVSTVVPKAITVETSSVQAIVGKEVTLKANIGVKEAGVPVTFNVDPLNNNLNKVIVSEVVTDANGVATFSYTQYNAGLQDDVAVYASGAPAVRDFASVHWGVDTILKIEADDKKSNELNNGENKVYKITYKDPKTGKPVVGADLNVTFAENVDVAINKITHATANGKTPYQTTNDKTEEVVVRTDSKGEATVTVSGTNTKATPVVFVDTSDAITKKANNKLDRTELNVKADELTFGSIHLKYEMEVTRDGGEEAAAGVDNGRVYKVVVKDENGKAASGEVVNVSFDEILDRVISTNTNAKFVIDTDLKGTTNIKSGSNGQQIALTLNSKGEGEFKIVGNDKDYATPVIWIDINSANNKEGTLEEGEPTKTAAITYFATEKIEGSKLKVFKAGTETEIKDDADINGADAAEFRFSVANQSNEKYLGTVKDFKATFEVTNKGTKDVYVWKKAADVGDVTKADYTISTRRGETVTLDRTDSNEVKLYVGSNGETANVEVTAYGEATGSDNKVVRLATSKVAKATFKSSADLSNSETLTVTGFNKDKKKIKLGNKKELDFKEAYDEDKVRYVDARGTSELNLGFQQFSDLIEIDVTRIHYFKDSNGVITFKIVSSATAPGTGGSTVDAVNAATTVAQVAAALANYAPYKSLIAADKVDAADDIFTAVGTAALTPAGLASYFATNYAPAMTAAVHTASVTASPGVKADAAIASLLTVTANNAGAELNGVEIEVVDTKNNQEIEVTLTGANGATPAKLTIEVANASVLDTTVVTTLGDLKAAIEAKLDVTVALDSAVASTDVVDVTDFVASGANLLEFANGVAAVAASAEKLELTFTHNVTLGSSVVINIGNTPVTATTATVKAGTDKNVVVLTLPAAQTITTGTVLTVVSGVTVDGYTIAAGDLTVTQP